MSPLPPLLTNQFPSIYWSIVSKNHFISHTIWRIASFFEFLDLENMGGSRWNFAGILYINRIISISGFEAAILNLSNLALCVYIPCFSKWYQLRILKFWCLYLKSEPNRFFARTAPADWIYIGWNRKRRKFVWFVYRKVTTERHNLFSGENFHVFWNYLT